MANNKSQLRTLLLQIRTSEHVRQEEHNSFAEYSGLSPEQIEILNVYDTPDFTPQHAEGYDGVFVGGTSEASVLQPEIYQFIRPAEALLRYCLDKSIPVFASCFGFQLATTALGGTIFRDEKNYEMGTLPISLAPAAKTDQLFHDTPNDFLAVSVHHERALEPPAGCVSLAYTDLCCHSFKAKDKPFWAFQFHPEVDKKILIERLTYYKAHYTDGDGHLDEVLANAQETPESNNLIRKFTDRILVSG